jgi:hypothetical protein
MKLTAAGTSAAAVLLLAACGSTPADRPPTWAATHPDTTGLQFRQAEGLCSFAVQYPDDAPGEIDYNGTAYIQRAREPVPQPTPGTLLGRSADWRVYQQSTTTVLLVTPTAAYLYRSGARCGTNEAPPS